MAETIDTAPKDGRFIIGATESWAKQWACLRFPYPLRVRWDGSKWRADDGHTYDPQPTHWWPDTNEIRLRMLTLPANPPPTNLGC